jgi:caa(3)-type oxidase subunit IV
MSETLNPDAFRAYARRCGLVFLAVTCMTLLMVWTSYMPLRNHALTIGIILAVASVNAGLVAGYLMHLISERKAIYTLLVFTGIFFTGLMGLSVFAAHDVPAVPHQTVTR